MKYKKKWNRYREKISGNMNCFDLLGFVELSRIAQKGARQGNASLTLLPASGIVDLEREGNRRSLTPAVRGRLLTLAPLIGVNCYGVRLSPKEGRVGQKCRGTNQHTPLSPLKRGVEENADAPKERGLERRRSFVLWLRV